MDQKKLQDKIIENYQSEDEDSALAQWRINHDLVPEEVYRTVIPINKLTKR